MTHLFSEIKKYIYLQILYQNKFRQWYNQTSFSSVTRHKYISWFKTVYHEHIDTNIKTLINRRQLFLLCLSLVFFLFQHNVWFGFLSTNPTTTSIEDKSLDVRLNGISIVTAILSNPDLKFVILKI